MDAEQTYLFDLQGYVVLKGVVPLEMVAQINGVLDRFEAMDPADYPPPLMLGPDHSASNTYVSNILEGDPAFRPLIDLPPVIDVISTVTGGPYRLNHTYAIYRRGGGVHRITHARHADPAQVSLPLSQWTDAVDLDQGRVPDARRASGGWMLRGDPRGAQEQLSQTVGERTS